MSKKPFNLTNNNILKAESLNENSEVLCLYVDKIQIAQDANNFFYYKFIVLTPANYNNFTVFKKVGRNDNPLILNKQYYLTVKTFINNDNLTIKYFDITGIIE